MTNSLLIFLSLVGLSLSSGAQIICTIPWPFENLRPDTITLYVFNEKTIPVKNMPGAKATSIVSFKTPDFNLVWMPIYQTNIRGFVERSTERRPSKPIDTLHFSIGQLPYITLVFKEKRGFDLVSYRNVQGAQDYFVTHIRRKKKLKEVIDYLETNL